MLLAAAMPPRGAAQGNTTVQGDTTVMLGTYYADRFVGRKTASGDIFRQNQYTAAHRTIPFGTYLLVHNPYTGLEIVVRVNDRCPVRNVLDMTKIAVLKLGIKGSRKVKVVTLDPEEGYALWIQQDTLAMSHEEYMAFKDKSPVRRMTPYKDGFGPPKASDTQPNARESAPVKPEAKKPVPTKPAPPPTTKAPAAATTPPPAEETIEPSVLAELPTPKQEKLFDLAICITGSRQSALRAIQRLPKDLQERAQTESLPGTRQMRVVLALATPRSHAIRVQAMLIEDFPDSFLVPHNDKGKGGAE